MMNDADLLSQFVHEPATRSGQDAFTALVERHLNLVYSAALRQVRSPQLAEEVSQSVFTQLANHAAALKPGTILAAWLHQVTHHAAIDVVRREGRRQAREQIACEMSLLMDDTPVDWTQIEPHLDEAVQSLDETDRAAILMRFFENKSLRQVGETLGTSEDAAQKRVSRAVDRLREYFVRNKIATATGGLASVLSAQAVQAAPAGLSATIASGSLAAAVSIPVSTSLTTAKVIAMTTFQKIAASVVLVGAVAAIGYQQHQVSQLRQENEAALQTRAQQTELTQKVQRLEKERDSFSNELASLQKENETLKNRPTEVLKLRGEVGSLQDQKSKLGATTAISKMTSTPEGRQLLHDQQKMGMSMIYKPLAQQLKLTPDQTDKLNDLLADYVIHNVDEVTTALRDKPTLEQMNETFASEKATLQQNLLDQLGPDASAQYEDYTKNLLSTLTVQQFKDTFTGSDDEKNAKAEKLRQAIQQETQSSLASAGLPSDFQTVPILNFVNIASEQQADQNIKLLQGIYQRVTSSASSYLTPDEITKLQAFTTKAIANNTAALNMNRVVMAPVGNQQ